MKKRKVGDLVSGAGSSSSDECTEAQVSVCAPRRACKLRLMFYSVSKAIELARTLKPEDAMRVRANEVKVGPGLHIRTFSFIEDAYACFCTRLILIFRVRSFGVRWRACSVRLKVEIWNSCGPQQLWMRIPPCGYLMSIIVNCAVRFHSPFTLEGTTHTTSFGVHQEGRQRQNKSFAACACFKGTHHCF